MEENNITEELNITTYRNASKKLWDKGYYDRGNNISNYADDLSEDVDRVMREFFSECVLRNGNEIHKMYSRGEWCVIEIHPDIKEYIVSASFLFELDDLFNRNDVDYTEVEESA